MLRSNKFGATQHINGELVVSQVVEEVKKVQASDKDRILEMIYCNDPETGLPQSDVGMYLSKDTPQVVRDFIECNIFVAPEGSCPTPEGVDDDTLMELTRDRYETRSQYVRRVNDYMARQKDEFHDSVRRSKNVK